jgi:hypothetical protein
MNSKRTEIKYEGTELELFAHAQQWKRYWSTKLASYAVGTVIEVGAGLGSSTQHMCRGPLIKRWLCLEPDPTYAKHLEDMRAQGLIPSVCEVHCCILADLSRDLLGDAIFYVDVLEHIENDAAEIRLAAEHLRRGGRLIVLSPAFNWLYSPFDKAIGHYRRYSRKDAKRLTAPGLELESVFFLDSVGMLASLANRILLRSDIPTPQHIRFWDQKMVAASVYLDYALNSVMGRSIVMIWNKT